jgi:hypothetical protein
MLLRRLEGCKARLELVATSQSKSDASQLALFAWVSAASMVRWSMLHVGASSEDALHAIHTKNASLQCSRASSYVRLTLLG